TSLESKGSTDIQARRNILIKTVETRDGQVINETSAERKEMP
ncbi:hypothetical protein chiPu_0022098, partial [Chiloscyllium punctatum]|nr:hypothetical protein [Chiloscyllium punctatum]